MKILNDFNKHNIDILLESINNNDICLILSNRLLSIIKSIHHPISLDFLRVHSNDNYNYKISLLDIDDNIFDDNGNKKLDWVSFMTSNKAIEKTIEELNLEIKNEEDFNNVLPRIRSHIKYRNVGLFNNKLRSSTSIGKIINKLFPNKYKPSGDPGNDIETFVNLFKSKRDTSKLFEIVSGDDIIYWYNQKNYISRQGGSLRSCMSYSRCNEYLEFYTKNKDKVKLLILKDVENTDKIKARALLWNLDSPSNRIFMDRIYFIDDYDVEVFKNYAHENEWIYKSFQDSNNEQDYIDSKNNIELETLVINNVNDTGRGHYPYMDTFKYFYNNTLTNDINYIKPNGDVVDVKKLESTDGGYKLFGLYWSDYYDTYLNLNEIDYTEDEEIEYEDSNDIYYCEWIDDYRKGDDCYYSFYYGVYIADDYAEKNMIELNIYSNVFDKYRKEGDYETLKNGDKKEIQRK